MVVVSLVVREVFSVAGMSHLLYRLRFWGLMGLVILQKINVLN